MRYLVNIGKNGSYGSFDIDKPLLHSSNLKIVKYLVNQGASITARNDALRSSAESGHLDVVKYLVEHGADTNEYYGNEDSLISAAKKGHLEVVQYMLNQRKHSGWPNYEVCINQALVTGAQSGRLQIVQYLVEHGADIHTDDDGPLRWSATHQELEVVKYLVDHGADIHACDDWALARCAQDGLLDMVKYLVEQGANIHALDDKALRVSAIEGHIDIVQYLVEHGANVYAAEQITNIDVLNYLHKDNQNTKCPVCRHYSIPPPFPIDITTSDNCPVCMTNMNGPYVFSCGHLVCSDCTRQLEEFDTVLYINEY